MMDGNWRFRTLHFDDESRPLTEEAKVVMRCAEKYDKFTSELGLLASVLYGAKLLFCLHREIDMFNIEFDYDRPFVMPPAFFSQAVAMIDKFHADIDASIRCAITAPWVDHKWQWKSHMPRRGVLQRRPYEEALLRYVPIDEGKFVCAKTAIPDRKREGNAPITPKQNEDLAELMEEDVEVVETNYTHAVEAGSIAPTSEGGDGGP